MIKNETDEAKRFCKYFWILAFINLALIFLGVLVPDILFITGPVSIIINLINAFIRLIFISKLNMYFRESYNPFVSMFLALVCYMPMFGEILFLIADKYKLGKIS